MPFNSALTVLRAKRDSVQPQRLDKHLKKKAFVEHTHILRKGRYF